MDDIYLPYSEIDLIIGDRDAALTIMYNGKRFHIHFTVEDLRGTQTKPSDLEQQFLRLRRSLHKEPEAFQDWVVEPCVDHMLRLAPPRPSTKSPTVADYFDAPTFIFKLENINGSLKAVRQADDPQIIQYLKPKVHKSNETVASALRQGVPCFKASKLEIHRKPDACDQEHNEVPRTVRMKGRSQSLLYFFKPAFDERSFVRELDSLLRIGRTVSRELRVSRLAGIVEWDDGSSMLGLLIEHIENIGNLDFAILKASSEEKAEWARRVHDIVEQLHAADVVWGDVKPDNVVIDVERKPWVVDFGGGFAFGWIDEDIAGTKEGDLQGLGRIMEFLGVH